MGFVDILDVGCESKRGFKNDWKVFDWSNGKVER